MTASSTALIERALSLLGSGVSNEATAAALGVSAAYISQLLSDEAFAEEVIKLRYENLQAHNKRDATYDGIEDELLVKLRKSLPLMVSPDRILKALHMVNNAKRRGQNTPEQVGETATIVSLTLPVQIVQTFITNSSNQVVKAGQQSLETITSGSLLKHVKGEQELLSTPAEQPIMELPNHEQEREAIG